MHNIMLRCKAIRLGLIQPDGVSDMNDQERWKTQFINRLVARGFDKDDAEQRAESAVQLGTERDPVLAANAER